MEKYFVTTGECEVRAAEIAKQIDAMSFRFLPIKIFGVPRGGIPIAYMISKYLKTKSEVIYTPEYADVIVDDLIDSGKTRERYSSTVPFLVLYNKAFMQEKRWIVFPWENGESGGAEDIVTRFFQYIGEDGTRPGLLETPKRVVKSWGDLYKGYNANVDEIFKVFDEPCDEMVILRNIEFYSMCEHHCLPFFGKVHIAYIPDGKVVGISKLARLVECFSRRLQIQERLTQQITEAIEKYLKPIGCACFIEAQHLCMMSRGVEKQNSVMITSSLRGLYKDRDAARLEFLLLNGRGGL
jgi:GTP cyclohydrolase I